MDSLRGQLLVAGPGLWDPNFRRTVVLIGHHDEDGAVGVVLNQPLDATVEEAAPPLSPLVPSGEPLFRGGPVQPEAAEGLWGTVVGRLGPGFRLLATMPMDPTLN